MPGKPLNTREAIILAILTGGERYGRDLRNEYEKRSKESMPFGSLYTTLDRMEEKGYVKSREGEANPERGGNKRKYYRITAAGATSLREMQSAFMQGGAAANG